MRQSPAPTPGRSAPRAPRFHLAVLLAAALACVHTADARLGETIKECVERYGEPVADPAALQPATPQLAGPTPDAVFIVGDYRVHCWFNSVGVCDRISYWHVARAGDSTPAVSSLQRRELVHILELNLAPDQSWTPIAGFGLDERDRTPDFQEEDYSWWRRTFAPETIPENPRAEEYSWWRRTFAPQTLPGYVPPPESGIRLPDPPAEPPLVDPGPRRLAPEHDLAWITPEGSRFALYRSGDGVLEILTRDAARRQQLREEQDDSLRGL